MPLHVRGDIRVRQSSRARHEIDDHLVDDADHRVVADVAVGHAGGGVVSEDTESLLHGGDILGRLIDQEIDVLRETARQ